MSSIGILAYGSLIGDPGAEIGPLIVRRVPATTPFPVEYARLSRKRGGAPTVVPHSAGDSVKAVILVLADSVSLKEGRNILWRRETSNMGSGIVYRESSSQNAVLVRDLPGFHGFDHVLYTDFNPNGKVDAPDPRELAKAAVESARRAEPGMDGISYLMNLMDLGVETALTPPYIDEILNITNTSILADALARAKQQPYT